MPRPITPPRNERGQKILSHLKDAGLLPLTHAAKTAGVNFDVLYRLLHIEDYRPEHRTVEKLTTKLSIPLALISPELARATASRPARQRRTTGAA